LIAEEVKDKFRDGEITGIMTPRVTKKEIKDEKKEFKRSINIFSRDIQIKSKPIQERVSK